ncbi:bestrophin family protein [Lichenicoccus sp.]|uniref:bestrophin family protein n=1 Tax=Lichenicoccus sp. TaxID=2781899 RepID=UPI003D0DCA30
MIVDRNAGALQLLRESLRPLLILFAWDLVVVGVFQLAHRPWMEQPALPVTLIGSALILFMSVRNNVAYARWWEARTLWGAVVNNTRSFARQAETLAQGRPDLTRAMVAYAHALRGGLLGAEVTAEIAPLLPASMAALILERNNKPNAILYEIGREISRSVRVQHLDGAVHAEIDRILSDIANAQGGLERIRNTPLAIQFSIFPGLIARIFCVLLPLSMVQELGWLTPFGSTLAGFLYIALDKIGADLENPFRDSVHAIPMAAITRTIEIDLLQSIGDRAPPPMAPERGVLR